jgi:transcriptional regulator with XRE-family HTH domain
MGLRELREAAVLTQAELAERAGVSPDAIRDIENGRVQPRPRTLRKIAEALGMSPVDLRSRILPRGPNAEDAPGQLVAAGAA